MFIWNEYEDESVYENACDKVDEFLERNEIEVAEEGKELLRKLACIEILVNEGASKHCIISYLNQYEMEIINAHRIYDLTGLPED